MYFFLPAAPNIFLRQRQDIIFTRPMKKTVWKNIFRLILPYKRKFLWVVMLGLLSTGASLVEPLIYREAINDVAGLFVRQARENAQQDLGLDPEEEESIRSMIREETDSERGDADTATVRKNAAEAGPATAKPAVRDSATTRKNVSGHSKKNS